MLSCCSDGMAGKKKTKEVACKHQKGKQKPDSSQFAVSFPIQIDDSVQSLLGDTIADIIFKSDSVRLVEVSPIFLQDTLHSDSIVMDSICFLKLNDNYYITKDFGWLCTSHISPLLFLLSDRQFFFVCDEMLLKTPFEGRVALRFQKEQYKVDVVFSFTGGQLKIYSFKNEQQIKYTQERLVLRYFQQYLKDETLQKILDNNLIE